MRQEKFVRRCGYILQFYWILLRDFFAYLIQRIVAFFSKIEWYLLASFRLIAIYFAIMGPLHGRFDRLLSEVRDGEIQDSWNFLFIIGILVGISALIMLVNALIEGTIYYFCCNKIERKADKLNTISNIENKIEKYFRCEIEILNSLSLLISLDALFISTLQHDQIERFDWLFSLCLFVIYCLFEEKIYQKLFISNNFVGKRCRKYL